MDHKGKVQWYNIHLGYGFIRHKNGQDVFVHNSIIPKDQFNLRVLKKGQLVTYNLVPNHLPPRAAEVKILS